MQGGTARGREVLRDEWGCDYTPRICQKHPASFSESAYHPGLVTTLSQGVNENHDAGREHAGHVVLP